MEFIHQYPSIRDCRLRIFDPDLQTYMKDLSRENFWKWERAYREYPSGSEESFEFAISSFDYLLCMFKPILSLGFQSGSIQPLEMHVALSTWLRRDTSGNISFGSWAQAAQSGDPFYHGGVPNELRRRVSILAEAYHPKDYDFGEPANNSGNARPAESHRSR